MSAYYNDNDPSSAAWLRELIKRGHIADGVVDERSILDVQPDDLRGFAQVHFFAGIGGWSYALRLAGWPDDRPVWTGSPPCQPFSSAGKGLSEDDPRHLSPKFAGLVRSCRPGVLFGEQVASAKVFGKAPSGSRKTAEREPEWAWLDDLCDRLEAARYAVGASDIPSAGVGAPHIRQRTFFGAVGMADSDDEGSQGHGRSENKYVQGIGREFEKGYAAKGHLASPFRSWRSERGSDGKFRQISPHLGEMSHWVSARVGRVRGYGNAINPWAAKVFIESFCEVLDIPLSRHRISGLKRKREIEDLV